MTFGPQGPYPRDTVAGCQAESLSQRDISLSPSDLVFRYPSGCHQLLRRRFIAGRSHRVFGLLYSNGDVQSGSLRELSEIGDVRMRDFDELRALGMKRHIARRDFLNGIAITGAYATLHGLPSLAKDAPENLDAASYPPLRTGL